jgi:hypothetical protein
MLSLSTPERDISAHLGSAPEKWSVANEAGQLVVSTKGISDCDQVLQASSRVLQQYSHESGTSSGAKCSPRSSRCPLYL